MNKPKTIAIIEPVGGYGGMDFYDYGLAQGIAGAGVQVRFYTCSDTQEIKTENVVTVKSFGDLWKKHKFSKIFAFYGGYRRSFKDARRNNCSVFHLHFFQISVLNLFVLLLARFYKAKKIVTLHDVDPLNNKSVSLIHSWSYKLMSHVIVHNTFSKKELLKKRIVANKISVIPHGNYLPFVDTLPEKERNEDHLCLLFFGQIKEVKGLDHLLEAIKLVTLKNYNVHLTIAGRPWHTDKQVYMNQISELGIEEYVSTRFEYIPNEEVPSIYESIDLVVLPYKRIYQSGVLLLSMSYGRACLVSDIEPFKETIEDSVNGFLYEAESVTDLANKIIAIINSNKIGSVRQNALNTLSEKYDWNKIGIDTINAYT